MNAEVKTKHKLREISFKAKPKISWLYCYLDRCNEVAIFVCHLCWRYNSNTLQFDYSIFYLFLVIIGLETSFRNMKKNVRYTLLLES